MMLLVHICLNTSVKTESLGKKYVFNHALKKLNYVYFKLYTSMKEIIDTLHLKKI